MVLATQFPDEQYPTTRATLVAIIGTAAVLIVEAEAVPAATKWTWSVLVDEEPLLDAELWQDFPPPSAGTLDGVELHGLGACNLAYAICRDLIQEATAPLGCTGSALFQANGGNAPNFSLNLCAAQPGLY